MKSPFTRRFCLAAAMFAVGHILLSACSPAATPPPTPTPGPLDIVKAYETAFNKHDLTNLMALQTETVVFRKPEWNEDHLSYDQVKHAYGFYFGANTEIHLSGCQAENGTVTCQIAYAEDCLRTSGSKEYTLNAVFTFEAGKIKSVVWNDPATDSKAFKDWGKFEEDFFGWYFKTYPDQYQVMINNFWQPENGPIFAQRCKEYGATLKK
jgi:hypothetical protein